MDFFAAGAIKEEHGFPGGFARSVEFCADRVLLASAFAKAKEPKKLLH